MQDSEHFRLSDSSFEVPPLPVIKIVLQLGSLGKAIFHTVSAGYQFQHVLQLSSLGEAKFLHK